MDASSFFHEPTSIFSTMVELYKKNQETQTFCPLVLIFHLAPNLIFIAVLKSTYPERMVLVTQCKQYFHVSAPLIKRNTRLFTDNIFVDSSVYWQNTYLLLLCTKEKVESQIVKLQLDATAHGLF